MSQYKMHVCVYKINWTVVNLIKNANEGCLKVIITDKFYACLINCWSEMKAISFI